ncbi:hypothetical protein DYB36_000112 [Aphanomyces astaci]|uniref:protein O-GlcNAc transferase n=2 Tax=Aphanomyces astaci TaxID=112090 RepID=A0A397AXM3_APHAT|nr:hypothetical protein DYB36_000112 [Aphanomyces astaci]
MRSRVTVAVVLALTWQPTIASPTAAEFIAQGVAYQLATHDLIQAKHMYQAALSVSPDNVEALHLLGSVAYHEGHFHEAQEYLEQAISVSPSLDKSAMTHCNLAETLRKLHRPADGLHHGDMCFNATGGSEFSLLVLAWLYKDLDEPRKAVDVLRRLVAMNDQHLEAWDTLGDLDMARQMLQRAYDVSHADVLRYTKLATLHSHSCPALHFTAPHIALGVGTLFEFDKTFRRLRIGFMSKFFVPNHAHGMLLRGVLAHLNRQLFHVTLVVVPDPQQQVDAAMAAAADAVKVLSMHLAHSQQWTIYMCPQSVYKLVPQFDRVLFEILRQDPQGHVVLLEARYPQWTRQLRTRLQQTINSTEMWNRVHFRPRVGGSDAFLKLLSVADVVLHPFPFGGSKTSADALLLGLPLVAMKTPFLRSRMAYSFYLHMDMLDCVASTEDEYIAIALRLGTDAVYRSDVRANMLSRAVRRSIHTTALRAATENASSSAVATKVTLNLSTPHQAFYKGVQVDLVQVPGLVGEYGVTAGHTPIISQLKPGVIAVHEERDKVVKKFFTAGGFAFTHADSTTDIAAVELIKVEDIDASAAEAGVQKYKQALEQAADGTPEKVEAQIAYETHLALVAALASA